ncbi:MAG: response regulator transcription factor [Sphingomonadales bacterium]|nr:response regulator transcription factor [Sphingomonadales bacterium]MDE2172261.1 response regulator transcription factor [Sphingomonadales bacterium]
MKILLIDDHAVVRAGLRRMLAMMQGAEILEASSGREGVAIARANQLDLIVLDLNMPELGGVELVARLRQIGPVPLLVLSMHAEPIYVTRALNAGAQGYVSKGAAPEELMTAIRKVSEGSRYIENDIAQALALQTAMPAGTLAQLAPRDLEILRQMAAGRSLHEIADALGLGYKTIANNCSMIKTRLGVSRTADLLRLALEAGLA